MCLAPGLFGAKPKESRPKRPLFIDYKYGNDTQISFSGDECLTVTDLRVLQVLVGLAGLQGLTLSPSPDTHDGEMLRRALMLTGDALNQDALAVNVRLHVLAHEAGYASSSHNTAPIEQSIHRMANVSITQACHSMSRGSRLLAVHHADNSSEASFWVALPPLIAESVLPNGQHVRIDLNEARALTTNGGRLLHQRLSGWINPGKNGSVSIEKLTSYLWPEETENENTKKTRRRAVRLALDDLIAVGWLVSEYTRNRFQIHRPIGGSFPITQT